MINDHYVGKSLQLVQNTCMIKPTSRDLIFDFSSTRSSVCMSCSNLKRCQVAFLLNAAVTNCTYFKEDAFLFGGPLENSAVAQKSLSL
jgi:hypothetical protein